MKPVFTKIESALFIGLATILALVSFYVPERALAHVGATFSCSPSTGVVAGTTNVLASITGGGLYQGTVSSITVGGVIAAIGSGNFTEQNFVPGATTPAGSQAVVITDTDGTATVCNITITASVSSTPSPGSVVGPGQGAPSLAGGGAVPQLNSVEPSKIVAGEVGAQATLRGNNFANPIVDINGQNLPNSAIVSQSSNEIVVKIPDSYTAKEGILNFRVSNNFGSPNIFQSAFPATVFVESRPTLEEVKPSTPVLDTYIKRNGTFHAASEAGLELIDIELIPLSLTGGASLPFIEMKKGSLKGTFSGLVKSGFLIIKKNGAEIEKIPVTSDKVDFFVKVDETESATVELSLVDEGGNIDFVYTAVFKEGKWAGANVSEINLDPSAFSQIREGVNTLTYRVTDVAGNVSVVSINFEVLPESPVEIEVVEEPLSVEDKLFLGIAPLEEELQAFSVSIFESDQPFADLSRSTLPIFLGIAPGLATPVLPPFIGIAPLDYGGISDRVPGGAPIEILLTPRGETPVTIELTPRKATEKDAVVHIVELPKEALADDVVIDFKVLPETDTAAPQDVVDITVTPEEETGDVLLNYAPPPEQPAAPKKSTPAAAGAAAVGGEAPQPKTINELLQGFIINIFGLNKTPSSKYFEEGHDASFSEMVFEKWGEEGHNSVDSQLKIQEGHSVYVSNLKGWRD